MKKNGILNPDLIKLIAEMGHTEKLVICDSGLPIPVESCRIDLALTKNIPRFLDVLEAVLAEMHVEKAILASEMVDVSPALHQKTKELLGDIPIDYCTHEEFKKKTRKAKGIVRSGEMAAYANIILISGVDF